MLGDRDDSTSVDALRLEFRTFADTATSRAPLYGWLSRFIADDPAIAGILLAAPATQRLPVLLFAAVHRALLDDRDDPLARWYPNLTDAPRVPDDALGRAFEQFVERNGERIRALVATRSTQTNEIGRCGLLLPALALVADEVAAPLSHVDVGTSGGLNLLLDRFTYRYVTSGTDADTGVSVGVGVGVAGSVELVVEVRGAMPMPQRIPEIAARVGIDRHPIDVTDDDAARWLEACVWPDQTDRFERLVAAIDVFREVTPPIVAGDAVTDLRAAIDGVAGAGHPVVTNTWVLNYLTTAERVAYLAELDAIGRDADISWVYAEAPALIPELPNEPDPRDPHLTVLSLVRWRNGERHVAHLATCHPHGYWIHWH